MTAAGARQKIPVFVISLARAADRRDKIVRHLQELGVAFRLIDGVDGGSLGADRQRELLAPGQHYHAGVIGCYMSHLQVYRRVVDEHIDVALVLEDDARLGPQVLSLLQAGCSDAGFDYCFLDSDDHNDRGPVFYDRDDRIELARGVRAHALSAGPQTLHAYLITRAGASRRLLYALPIEKPIDLYDHLPGSWRFRAVVAPKLAWVSEDSLVSFTSDRNDDASALSFAALRRSIWFYKLRDLLRLKGLRGRAAVARLVQQGQLPAGRRWAPLPSGREVVL